MRKLQSDNPLGALIHRRDFLRLAGMSAASLAVSAQGEPVNRTRPSYRGPNVVVIRFGGGVRRRETIDQDHTYCPYLAKELVKRGTLFPRMMIEQFQDINTSHGEGTLYILTGKYEKFRSKEGKGAFNERFEANSPTVFEYLRKSFDVPEHQTVIVNGEDRTQEEFYSFSNHHLFGADFRSETLSLFRFKIHLLRHQIAEGVWKGQQLKQKKKTLQQMESMDYRTQGNPRQCKEIEAFWTHWRQRYGKTGMVNERGDRLLTSIALDALEQLRPKLLMVNYNDPDYVHWGNMMHYTRGISVIDDGVRQLVRWADTTEGYRNNTIFVIVPDCGRDNNQLLSVPCQHHFNSRSSHEIWALFFGPGIARDTTVYKHVDQSQIAATIGRMMGMKTPFAESRVLEEAIA